MTDEMDAYRTWVRRTTQRMKRGVEEYGNASFDADPLDLLEEIQQELEDTANWAYILWKRLEATKRKLNRAWLKEQEADD